MKPKYWVLIWLFSFTFHVQAESIRALIDGKLDVSLHNPGGVSIPLSYNSSVIISLDQEVRFFRGIELELTAPQAYLGYHGSLAIGMYAKLDRIPELGIVDIEADQISFEPIPNKIQTVYQIPIRSSHGLRTTPYVSVPTVVIPPSAFPILFRVMPVIKGLNEEIETMSFQLHVKPILSNEGAIKIIFHYPEHVPGKPFTILIDDAVIEKPEEEQLLKEGEHHLLILSEDYRNESRRFLVERGKSLELVVILQDTIPLIIFEAPENALIYLDNELLANTMKPYPVEPGMHEVKFQMSDYSIVRPLTVQKGKTYRVAFTVDVNVSESE